MGCMCWCTYMYVYMYYVCTCPYVLCMHVYCVSVCILFVCVGSCVCAARAEVSHLPGQLRAHRLWAVSGLLSPFLGTKDLEGRTGNLFWCRGSVVCGSLAHGTVVLTPKES